MVELTDVQIADLVTLQQLCAELKADVVIIAAIAYQIHFPEQDRHTTDIDSAVALDLEDFERLRNKLSALGWTNTRNLEHRWQSTSGTYFDLIPAGNNLRKSGRIEWPNSHFVMSLVGFDHVFSGAETVDLNNQLRIRVITPVVLTLLKIVAFLENPARRKKDLSDIRAVLALYQAETDRIFSDEVLDAGLSDFSLVNAFLLGIDLRSICKNEEAAIVKDFLSTLNDDSRQEWLDFVRAARSPLDRTEQVAKAQLVAFRIGFESRNTSV